MATVSAQRSSRATVRSTGRGGDQSADPYHRRLKDHQISCHLCRQFLHPNERRIIVDHQVQIFGRGVGEQQGIRYPEAVLRK